MATLDETLQNLNTLLPALQSNDTIGPAAGPFCDAFLDLFRAVSSDIGRADYQTVLNFLKSSSGSLHFGFGYLGQDLIHRMDSLLNSNWEGLEWITLCELRSTFEGLKDLYEDYLPVERYMPDIDEIDARLEAKGEVEAVMHPQLTPTNFPEHHWWWLLG